MNIFLMILIVRKDKIQEIVLMETLQVILDQMDNHKTIQIRLMRILMKILILMKIQRIFHRIIMDLIQVMILVLEKMLIIINVKMKIEMLNFASKYINLYVHY